MKIYMPTVWLLTLSAILSACVTINIYFPAAAAEKAADKIIDEVWQLKQSGGKDKKTDVPVPTVPIQPINK